MISHNFPLVRDEGDRQVAHSSRILAELLRRWARSLGAYTGWTKSSSRRILPSPPLAVVAREERKGTGGEKGRTLAGLAETRGRSGAARFRTLFVHSYTYANYPLVHSDATVITNSTGAPDIVLLSRLHTTVVVHSPSRRSEGGPAVSCVCRARARAVQ